MKHLRAWIVLALALVLAASFGYADEPAPSPSTAVAPIAAHTEMRPEWLPPGADAPDRGPSEVIFPRQSIAIRFNHKLHIGRGETCAGCHTRAQTSDRADDRLLPAPTGCDRCHGSNHTDLSRVLPGSTSIGACAYCHLGYEQGNTVKRTTVPPPNLRFSHKKHADRNVGCPQCHGEVRELELATRDQLPRMRGCLRCHERTDAASQGDAKSACDTCHLRSVTGTRAESGGRIRTMFASGALVPPTWLRGAAHTPDFLVRHKYVAAADSAFCANCHKEDECVACHDGRVRPRSIHPNDYLNMHSIEARRQTQRCTSCHHEQSFCLGCHQRLGITMSGPPGVRDASRFHPPRSVWTDGPRRSGHHALEAMRNLNACVSCHIERDCVVCHGGKGTGSGLTPHRPGFLADCARPFQKNPRPCFVCHDPGDEALAPCR